MAKFEVRLLRDKSKILHISSGKQKYLRTKKVAISPRIGKKLKAKKPVISLSPVLRDEVVLSAMYSSI